MAQSFMQLKLFTRSNLIAFCGIKYVCILHRAKERHSREVNDLMLEKLMTSQYREVNDLMLEKLMTSHYREVNDFMLEKLMTSH